MTDKLCSCCGKASVAGYVSNGVSLDKLCLKCWRKGGDASDPHNQKNGHATTGKS